MIDNLINYLRNKKILILGFGREGQSTYKLIRKYLKNQSLFIADEKKDFQEAYDFLKEDNHIKFISGEKYLDNLEDYDIIMKTPGISFVGIDTTNFLHFYPTPQGPDCSLPLHRKGKYHPVHPAPVPPRLRRTVHNTHSDKRYTEHTYIPMMRSAVPLSSPPPAVRMPARRSPADLPHPALTTYFPAHTSCAKTAGSGYKASDHLPSASSSPHS